MKVDATVAQHASKKFTLAGDTALLTVAVRPDKAADFEPLPDGNLASVHVIHPVISGADYAVMQTLYDAFPDERQSLYELYRGAFVQNVSLATGQVVLDMSKHP